MERLSVVGQLLVTFVVIGAVLYALTVVVVVDGLGGARALLGPTGLLVVVGAGASAATLAALQRIGPAWATRLDVTWRDVATLVRGRQRGAALGVVVGAAVLAVVLGAGSHLSGGDTLEITVVSIGAVMVAAVVAWLGQHADRPGTVRGLASGCALLAVGVVCAAAGAVPLLVLAASCLATLVLVAAGAPGSLTLRPRRGLRLSSPPPRWSLERAGRFVEALVTSAITTDTSALELLRGGNAAAARRPRRPWPVNVFLVRSLTSARVAVMLPLLALPAGMGVVWGAPAAAATVLVATFVLTARAGTALDAWVEHPALRRAYARRGRSVPVLLVASTASLTLAYAAVGVALASLPLLWVVAATGFALLGTLRRVAGRSLIGESGPLLATPAGPIPVGVGRRLLAGNDALALALVAGLGLTAPVAAVVAVVLLGVAAVRRR